MEYGPLMQFRQCSGKSEAKFKQVCGLAVKNVSNSALWVGIVRELQKGLIPLYLMKLVCSYLDDRRILVVEGQTMYMTCGVQQSCVLKPMPWNLYCEYALRLEMP